VRQVTEGVDDGRLRGRADEKILTEFGSLQALRHLF
jgi:hypothetical protein